MSPIPPLTAVRVFEAASRHENFSRAAEELALTQAAVSYQMKLLEERIGAPLFARRGRGMALTDLGRRIAPRINEAFNLMSEAFAIARAENDSVLSITAPRTFAINWLSGRLGKFHETRPDLAVRLDASDEIAGFTSGQFDIAIRGSPAPGPQVLSHFLMRMPVTPMASPSFLAAHPLKTPADLATVTRLSPNEEWWDLWFNSLNGSETGNQPNAGLLFESQVLDGHAAIAGHGVAILSPPMFQSAIDQGLLVQPFAHVANYRKDYWLVYPEQKRNLRKVRAFRDWILDEVKRAAGNDPHGILVPLGT